MHEKLQNSCWHLELNYIKVTWPNHHVILVTYIIACGNIGGTRLEGEPTLEIPINTDPHVKLFTTYKP